MDIRELESFVTIVKLKSFSRAADKLFLTQPTITSHIQKLENNLGTILINRSGKNLTLTDAGETLYGYALNILNMRDMAEFDLGVYKGKIQGHLEISSSSIPKQYVLPTILKGFCDNYPDVTFSITHDDSKSVVENILSGYTDFGIVGAKYHYKNLKYIDLVNDTLVLVVPNNKEYPYDAYEKVNKCFLFNKKIIFREQGSGTRLLIERALKEHSIKIDNLNIVAYVEETETIKKFIEKGLGISIISERAIKKEVLGNSLKPLLVEGLNLNRKFYFVYHQNRQLSPLTQTFKEYVLSYIDSIDIL